MEEEIETSEEVDKGSTEVANSSSDNTKLNPAPSKPAQSKSESTPEPTSEPSKPEPTLEPSKSESTPEPSKSEPIPEPSKSEPTPQPKPEPQPEPTPPSSGREVPSGIPSGASYVKGDDQCHVFDYSSSLPNGGSVIRVTPDFIEGEVLIRGTDNSGRGFGAVYKRSSLGFMYGAPDLDDADKDALRNIGSDFLSAYGK